MICSFEIGAFTIDGALTELFFEVANELSLEFSSSSEAYSSIAS